MLQTSLLLLKSLNKNQDSHFLICSVFFVSKGNLFDVYFTSVYFCLQTKISVLIDRVGLLQ